MLGYTGTLKKEGREKMAIEKVYLDPNAVTYTDDEIVGKVNAAAANITKAGAIESTALSGVDSDDIGEGSTNKYDTGVPLTAVQTKDAIVAMADDDREILISRPTTGQKKIYAVQTHSDGKQEIEQSDTAES